LTEEVKDLTPKVKVKSDEQLLQEMLGQLQTLNKIAVLKEEDYVIRSIIKGKYRKTILEELNKKHPNEKISKKDLDDFLLLYRDVLQNEVVNTEKGYVRRLIKSKEGLTNNMVDLALTAKDMATRYDQDDDHTNAVGAIRAAADIFMKFAKLEGLATDQPEVNINMQMDKMVTEVTAGNSAFKDAVLKVMNKKEEAPEPVEAEFEVKDE